VKYLVLFLAAMLQDCKKQELPPSKEVVETDPPSVPTTLTQYCADCHGWDLRKPKKGLIFESGVTTPMPWVIKAMKEMRKGDMPKGEEITKQQIYELEDELLSLVNPDPTVDRPSKGDVSK
jgi:cytochrome c553